jgi:hypothetical protein
MMPCTEALGLLGAKLSASELEQVDKLDALITNHIKAAMKRSGITMNLMTTNPNVVAELTVRAKAGGWNPQWQGLMEQSNIRGMEPRHVGYQLILAPGDEALAAVPATAAVSLL